MVRWCQAATDLRHALARPHLLPLRLQPNSLISTSIRPKIKRKGDEETDRKVWPKPTEIRWQPKVANSVNIIGHIKTPVEFLNDGKKDWAGATFVQESSSKSKSSAFRISLLFEGDLAKVADSYVKENDHVHVSGYLTPEPSPIGSSTRTGHLKLMVKDISYIKESRRKKSLVDKDELSHAIRVKEEPCENSGKKAELSKDGGKKDDLSRDRGTAATGNPFVEESWRDLLLKPHEWCDIST